MTKRSKLILFAAVILIIASIATACQPTPDNGTVISKNNTEKEIEESAEQYKDVDSIEFDYEVPAHVTERYPIVEGNLDMVIDADVIMPELDRVPVAKVGSDPFTQERADELIEYFMEDGILVSSWTPTKEYFDELIVEAKKGHLVDGEYVFDEDSQMWLDELLQMREDAPDKDIQELITDYSISNGQRLNGRIVIDGEVKGSVSASEKAFYFNAEKSFRSADRKNYDEMTGEEIEMPQREFDFTCEQAEAKAQALLSELSIEGMKVVETEKIYYFEGSYTSDVDYGGYLLTFMREFGGLTPAKEVGFGMGPNDSFDVSPPIETEMITVAVNEYGEITMFTWRNPVKILGTMTEHVDILPFEDILARLEEWSKIQFAFMGGYSMETMMIKDVYEIRLGLNYLPIQNNPDEYMYAPCWFFVYKDWQEFTEEQLESINSMGGYFAHWDEMGDEYFIFSAIDGASVSVYSQALKDEVMSEYEMPTPMPED
ncbi:MAG: hypothetical protein JXN65_08440 [Clostridia bacterium]|nr:hypothetical protein [Clostridia bacterium]